MNYFFHRYVWGKKYVSRGTKKVIAAKNFEIVFSCCQAKCFTNTNSSLNLSKLYQLFIRFYELIYENKKCPIIESTYCKYSNHFVNFTFDMPRTDVCNDCITYEQTDAQMTNEAVYHYRKVNLYRELKK